MSPHALETLSPKSLRRMRWLKLCLTLVCKLTIAYGIVAYTILPAVWHHYEYHPKLVTSPKFTRTAEGISGNPYYTDGKMTIALLSNDNLLTTQALLQSPNPPTIQAKHRLWQWVKIFTG
jgi:hypothetical protein